MTTAASAAARGESVIRAGIAAVVITSVALPMTPRRAARRQAFFPPPLLIIHPPRSLIHPAVTLPTSVPPLVRPPVLPPFPVPAAVTINLIIAAITRASYIVRRGGIYSPS